MKYYLSFDLGASSGRAVVIEKDKTIKMIEISRFQNKTYIENEVEYWDMDFIFENIIATIKKAFLLYPTIAAIGIDSWGVDYALVNDRGKIIKKPLYYRNVDTKKAIEFTNEKLGEKNLYMQNGIQFLYFNSIYQLVNDYKKNIDLYKQNVKMLMIPDLIAYYLTGNIKTEITNLSTTGIYNPYNKNIIKDIKLLGIKENIIPEMIMPGESYGLLKPEITNQLNIPTVPIVAVCTHDTASAVCSLPLSNNNIFISSGTWSLFGALLDGPIITKQSLLRNYTNEVGFGHKIRFLKNIVGLFIINKCIEEFKNQGLIVTYDTLVSETENVLRYQSFIDVDHEMFQNPKSMVIAIQKYCEMTHQAIPRTIGEITICVYQSIAFKYRTSLYELKELTGDEYNKIFIIGGGSSIDILNQITASVTELPVVVSVKEATILGNALVLMLYDNEIQSLEVGRELIKESFKQKIFHKKEDLRNEYQEYIKVIQGGKKWKI